ncbi:NAD-dependent epimerase/dehydratase family protein [Cylindrospermopsis raciborskii]|uniref:NAD-dependent epimerase/dehydratase family protein n=1 Tax=Cylindrospermopsis raciborskii TaxID=77022 RepID=UPI0008DCEBB0|nr:NAD(P)-dependent oxidoreductase [Cylindrospermopsis raciborskii]NLQ05637.1 NAD(P)-dependent oxidoreductase [Cylindrospermopsis raciborskii MVCC19]OHY34207.1 hypothetical protein BCV64_06570 [Cylindrospermopsis raciborskii MVCC14]
MKVAVTGATGFIGRHITSALLKKGYDVLLVGRSNNVQQSGLPFVQLDLLEERNHNWISEYKPSHLLHLAWYTEHGDYWESPLNINWCHSTINLIHAFAVQGGKRIVVSGSCAEYDWSFGYCNEIKTPSYPSSLYGTGKDCARRMSERICNTYKVSLAWGRIFLPFGSGENPKRLIPSITRAIIGSDPPFPIRVCQWRDFLPVEMVADGFLFLLEQDYPGIFNICSGKPVQLSEIVKRIGFILNKSADGLMLEAEFSTGYDSFLVGDNRCITMHGWHPDYDLWHHLGVYVNSLVRAI